MKGKLPGHLAVLGTNVIFGLNAPATKALMDKWLTPVGYMSSRTVFALVVFWLLSLFSKRESVSIKDLAIIVVGSLTGFVIAQYCTAMSLEYTSPVYFSLISSLSPVCVMFISFLFLHEPITKRKTMGVIFGIAGAFLLILSATGTVSGADNVKGIIFAVLSMSAFAVYIVATRAISLKYSPVTQMKWVFLIASIVWLPLGIIDFDQQILFSSEWDWDGVGELAFIIIFSTIVAYLLMPFGMKYLRPTTVSVYMNFQPIVASAIAILIGQDSFTWQMPVAAIMVLGGAYIVSTSRTKTNENIK